MSSAPTADEIARDACWLAQALDPSAGLVRLVAMDREAYRQASFLDDRLMQQTVDAQIVAWPKIDEAMTDNLRSDARWIFHIGHVGSTLVSRLLGELPGVLGVREPRLLRDLALSPSQVRRGYMRPVARLMSRTFARDEIACVKATSFVSEIAPDLVPAGERALFMFASPRNYIASILAGENSLKEQRVLANSRAMRLQQRAPSLPEARNDADLAALAWACEMTALVAAAEAMQDRRIAWGDFDVILANMPGELERISSFFGFAVDPAEIAAVSNGPLVRRYSKALEYDYSAQLRRDLIEHATAEHRQALDGAMAMLNAAAEKAPLLANAMARVGGH